MHERTEQAFPIVAPSVSVQETIRVMTHRRMGLTWSWKMSGRLGIITDGDLRRAMMDRFLFRVRTLHKTFSSSGSRAIDEKAL